MEHRFPWASPQQSPHSLNWKRAPGTDRETQEGPSVLLRAEESGLLKLRVWGAPGFFFPCFSPLVSLEGVRAGEAGLGVREESSVQASGHSFSLGGSGLLPPPPLYLDQCTCSP